MNEVDHVILSRDFLSMPILRSKVVCTKNMNSNLDFPITKKLNTFMQNFLNNF